MNLRSPSRYLKVFMFKTIAFLPRVGLVRCDATPIPGCDIVKSTATETRGTCQVKGRAGKM